MRESLVHAIKDHSHGKKEAMKWKLIGDYIYKRLLNMGLQEPLLLQAIQYFPTPIDLLSDFDYSDGEFPKTLEDLATKQKRQNK